MNLWLYRRCEEITRWEEFVNKHFLLHQIPTNAKQRAQFHKEVTPVLLTDPSFRTLHEQFHTKIDLAIDLIESAIHHGLPFSILLFDGWYLSEELVAVARVYRSMILQCHGRLLR